MDKKRNGQVRIIGGTHRSRVVRFADAAGLRPTADSVRERLFNWLGQNLAGCTVLDAFAGSGVLGFEAASRGAARVVAVEENPAVARALAQNLQALQLPAVRLHCGGILPFLDNAAEGFDVVFLDPPYAWRDWDLLWAKLLPHLHAGARVYAEAAQEILPPPQLAVLKRGKSGMSRFALFQAA